MAIEDRATQVVKSFKCVAALATNHLVVVLDTAAANSVEMSAANTDVPIGVLRSTGATAGDLVDVVMFGIAKLTAGAAITRGAHLQLSGATDGKVKTLVATGYDIGTALESAASGDIFEAFINIIGIPKA